MEILFSILIFHYLFDWLAQPRWVAENKSKNIKALLVHVGIYTTGLCLLAERLDLSIEWVLFNGFLHFVVDFISSKVSSKAFQSGNMTLFWNVIGLDQLIHYLTLYGTLSI